MHSVLWRRLDQEGHDACRYSETAKGWSLEGVAVFEHARCAASLMYRLMCDREWHSRSASVSGWIGQRPVELSFICEDDGNWRINGQIDPTLAGLKDVDLGFTPASNTNAIRRLNLSSGEGADPVAVWLDTDDWTVKKLPQSYLRTSTTTFAYASPQHDYQAALTVDTFGAVTEYPGLWTMLHHV